jgi:hypothetical protein
MATTTNYSWTTPDDTALVKDGASAIRALGTAIDTSMNTALGTKKAGMVLLNTTSFSGVASQSINNVFTSAYKSYQIVIDTVQSNAEASSLRLRASGTDLSGSVYYSSYMSNGATSSAFGGGAQNGTTSFDLYGGGTYRNFQIIDITQVQATERTLLTYDAAIAYNSATKSVNVKGAGMIDNAISYDGFTIYVANTITGSIRVYGRAE